MGVGGGPVGPSPRSATGLPFQCGYVKVEALENGAENSVIYSVFISVSERFRVEDIGENRPKNMRFHMEMN